MRDSIALSIVVSFVICFTLMLMKNHEMAFLLISGNVIVQLNRIANALEDRNK